MFKKNKNRTNKRQNIIELVVALLIVVLLNVVGTYLFYRIDLTGDKRYTLSKATKEMLKDLDDVVFVKVYLEGDFPAGFKRLSRETKEMLNEFRAYSKNVEYEFIDPSVGTDKKQIGAVYQQLMEKGLEPTSLQVKDKKGSTQKIIFPGCIITYKGKDAALSLLKTKAGVSPDEQLNNSVQGLEYELTNVIRKLSIPIKKRIAFVEGHGEYDKFEVGDITQSLSEYYTVERVRIDGKLNALSTYNAIIIANPDSAMDDKDKYIIDQFIMRGGKVMWFIDPLLASMDSMRNDRSSTMAINKQLGLDFQLFRYGVKMRNDLVQDLNALPIPIQTGVSAGKPQYDFRPWFYFPLAEAAGNHPIVNNLEYVRTEFTSSIDTSVISPKIKKTVLLRSSRFSKTEAAPVYITLNALRESPNQASFNQPNQTIAVLLEGTFESFYKNRLSDEFMAKKDSFKFREESRPTKMVVVSDGDIIRNQLRETSSGNLIPLPLGYDMYSYSMTKTIFGNKTFILNAMNYLLDDSNLISIRSRELTLRLLNKTKIEQKRVMWQVINMVAPLLLVFVFGVVLNVMRKRRYSK